LAGAFRAGARRVIDREDRSRCATRPWQYRNGLLRRQQNVLKLKSDITLFEELARSGEWRVEYFDDDGGCYVTIFAGPGAEWRARDYQAALQLGVLTCPARLTASFQL
jgi:hypothetical protein